MNKFDQERLAANTELGQILVQLIIENPTMRFGQILRNFEFVDQDYLQSADMVYWKDEFNMEPQEVLDRVKSAIKKLRPGRDSL